MKKDQGKVLISPFSTIKYRVNSLGKPPMIQLKGLTIMYAPAREVDKTMICSENLKVSSPKGIVKTT